MRRKEGLFWVAQVGIFVAVLAVVALPMQQTNVGQASTSQTSKTVQGTALGSDGLQLSASLNASQLTPGQALKVNVSVFNTFSTTNSVPITVGWPFQGIPLAIWPNCDIVPQVSSSGSLSTYWAAEAVVLKGDYTTTNLSSVADIHALGEIVQCSEWMPVEQVTFQPSTAQANLAGYHGNPSMGNSTVGPYPVAGTFTTNGYWEPGEVGYLDYQGEHSIDSPITTPFTPGVYTVGIEDIWGQYVILHVEVE